MKGSEGKKKRWKLLKRMFVSRYHGDLKSSKRACAQLFPDLDSNKGLPNASWDEELVASLVSLKDSPYGISKGITVRRDIKHE